MNTSLRLINDWTLNNDSAGIVFDKVGIVGYGRAIGIIDAREIPGIK
jgi:hypothetical protein